MKVIKLCCRLGFNLIGGLESVKRVKCIINVVVVFLVLVEIISFNKYCFFGWFVSMLSECDFESFVWVE